jgi:GNAT superfamily N-acetyltransferase
MRFTAADRPAADILPAYLASHPPDHVDAPVIAGEDSRAHLARILSGELGRALEGSALAVDGDGRVVGAILVNEFADTDPPFGGPWVMELFRAPGARGVGRALLERALSVTEGTLGLAVTHGNRAEGLYAALGFERVFSAFSVDL